MNDTFKNGKTLREIAQFLGGSVRGDDSVVIRDVRAIDEAGEGDLTFIANPKYRKKLETTKASAVLVTPDVSTETTNLLVIDDPYVALARTLAVFYPERHIPPGGRDEAYIHHSALVADDAAVYPGVYIGENVKIDQGVVLYPGVFIGNDVRIGADSIIYPNVTVYRKCQIGRRVVIHAGAVIGSDGFGFANPGVENFKVPQIGYVQIDDNVEIGAGTTIDRGALGKTWIQQGAKIDNLVQIAHNVVIGEKSVIVAQVGISGSSKLGRSVIMGGQTGVAGHIEIGDYVMVAAKSGIHKDIPPQQIVAGIGQMPHREWLRTQACLPRLPEMRKNVQTLMDKIEILEDKIKYLESKTEGSNT